MKKTHKVKLIEDDLTTLGAMVNCCNVRQWIPNELECGEQWDCVYCKKPLVFRATGGLWYYVGERVFQ
jgi:hypothetical protein